MSIALDSNHIISEHDPSTFKEVVARPSSPLNSSLSLSEASSNATLIPMQEPVLPHQPTSKSPPSPPPAPPPSQDFCANVQTRTDFPMQRMANLGKRVVRFDGDECKPMATTPRGDDRFPHLNNAVSFGDLTHNVHHDAGGAGICGCRALHLAEVTLAFDMTSPTLPDDLVNGGNSSLLFLEIRSRNFVALTNSMALPVIIKSKNDVAHPIKQQCPIASVLTMAGIKWIGEWEIPMIGPHQSQHQHPTAVGGSGGGGEAQTLPIEFRIYRSRSPEKPFLRTVLNVSPETITTAVRNGCTQHSSILQELDQLGCTSLKAGFRAHPPSSSVSTSSVRLHSQQPMRVGQPDKISPSSTSETVSPPPLATAPRPGPSLILSSSGSLTDSAPIQDTRVILPTPTPALAIIRSEEATTPPMRKWRKWCTWFQSCRWLRPNRINKKGTNRGALRGKSARNPCLCSMACPSSSSTATPGENASA